MSIFGSQTNSFRFMHQVIPGNTEPALVALLNEKISSLVSLEDTLPCVYIIHDMRDFSLVYMSRQGRQRLGRQWDEERTGRKEYFSSYFKIEDSMFFTEKLLEHARTEPDETFMTFFEEVRTGPDQAYEWYLSSSRVMLRDTEGNPRFSLTISMPINIHTHVTKKVARVMEENRYMHAHQHHFGQLTKREKQILACMARNMTSQSIGEQLFISEKTVATHRKNIKRKIGARTDYDVIKFAQTFDLI